MKNDKNNLQEILKRLRGTITVGSDGNQIFVRGFDSKTGEAIDIVINVEDAKINHNS